ncbi:hypothetical protein V495_04151 [Pseudogymnoascus sp. VKM F-4514 (FW-929)]|nr:hypothetical protein V495_04151 [Pseudogymnoascus sp. VKM F-4514 (FW-929)]KFY60214.1 hypothetical protein V497_03786 [Pseudogymnoascus sp. VKM F-4516 (FW-969)]
MKFNLAVLCVTFGTIVVQAIAATTPLAQLKCTPGFYLCARNDAWCNGKESIAVCRRVGDGFDLRSCCADGCKTKNDITFCN